MHCHCDEVSFLDFTTYSVMHIACRDLRMESMFETWIIAVDKNEIQEVLRLFASVL